MDTWHREPMRVAVFLLLHGAGCSPRHAPTIEVDNMDTLHGERLRPAIAIPEFSARSQDDTPRTLEDLRGHPTAMWFFPLVGTPG